MKGIGWLIFIFVGFLYMMAALSGCASAQTQTTPSVVSSATPAPAVLPSGTPKPKSDLRLAWHGKHKDAGKWTDHALNRFSMLAVSDVIPSDFKEFCPNYDRISRPQRVEVLAHMLSKMVERESGFDPKKDYQESFKGSDGKYIISRGLMQMSLSSANAYGCGFSKATDLHDGMKNLSCAMTVLNRWIVKDGRFSGKAQNPNKPGKFIYFGAGRYWSVMRPISGSQPKIRAYLNALPHCRN